MRWGAVLVFIVLLTVLGGGYFGYEQLKRADVQGYAPEKYQPARDARLPPPAKNSKLAPKAYEPSCKLPQTRDDADLCAQWAAVQAVSESNRLTRTGLWVNALEFGALILSLFFTGWAAIAAAKAAGAANKTVHYFTAVERPRLAVSPAWARFDEDDHKVVLQLQAENMGRTTAHVKYLFWATMEHNAYIPKQAYYPVSSDVLIHAEKRENLTPIRIPLKDAKDYVWGFVEYGSAFDLDHTTYFCVRIDNHPFDEFGGGGPEVANDKGISWPKDS